MAYALSYLDIYGKQLNVTKLRHEMNNLMVIYGLSDMVYRGITLVKYYAPDGVTLSEIIHSCFCSHYNKTDVEVQQELGIGRTSFYKMKKQALRYLGFYFYEIVVPQAKKQKIQTLLGCGRRVGEWDEIRKFNGKDCRRYCPGSAGREESSE